MERRIHRLLHVQEEIAILLPADAVEHRRARDVVPAPELPQVDARGVLHRLHEVVAGNRLPVMPLEVKPHARLELLFTQQRVLHAHDLRAFLVHRHGVEVADLLIGLRPYRVLHRPGVLRELVGAQRAHFLDARHRARIGVRAVFLVAEHRQAFLQRQLEPVPAGDAVPGPVVEVLVRHHAVDVQVVDVGRGVGAREHVARVEDVEALVLHRAGVEVAHRDDLVFAPGRASGRSASRPRRWRA